MDRRLLALGLVALLAGCGGGHKAATRTAPATIATIGGTSVSVPPPLALTPWSVTSDNVTAVPLTVTATGAPVAGVQLRVDGFALAPTDSAGPHRLHRGLDPPRASRRNRGRAGDAITVAVPDQRASLRLRARDSAGNPTVSGRISYADGTAPPVVSRYSYELTGNRHRRNGHPVADARVSTRTVDRDYWTVSGPTDAQGRYSSLFTASSERRRRPRPLHGPRLEGRLVYEFLSEEVVDVPTACRAPGWTSGLPPHGYPMALPLPLSYPGASTRASSSAPRSTGSRCGRSARPGPI